MISSSSLSSHHSNNNINQRQRRNKRRQPKMMFLPFKKQLQVVALLLLLLAPGGVQSFSLPGTYHLLQDALHVSQSSLPHINLLQSYENLLKEHTLPTQIITGASLAVIGDGIAQKAQSSSQSSQSSSSTTSSSDSQEAGASAVITTMDTTMQDKTFDDTTLNMNFDFDFYDIKRGISFAMFDVCYRVLQHYAFPYITEHCQGQYFGSIPILHNNFDIFFLSTIERTLANQMIIVPFLYYPAFFILTGVLQGLTLNQMISRGKETFWFLYLRNIAFWIPIQYIQFGFIDEELQIPFICVAGLIWTTILSILAGNVASSSSTTLSEEEAEAVPAVSIVETTTEELLLRSTASVSTVSEEDNELIYSNATTSTVSTY